MTDQTYTFHFKLTHSVPPNGFFSFLLSEDEQNGVKISDHDTVQNNCYLVTRTGDKLIECTSGETEDDGRHFVNITCSEDGFGPYGTLKGQILSFKIKGLTNPRARFIDSYFQLYTMDEQFRYIDKNFEDQQFFVRMSELKSINSLAIKPESKVNGYTTTYEITVNPSTRIYPYDMLQMDFPPEIGLPVIMECSSPDLNMVREINCFKSGTSTVHILLVDISDDIFPGTVFKLYVHNLINSRSTRPTSAFENIVIRDSLRDREMAGYSKSI